MANIQNIPLNEKLRDSNLKVNQNFQNINTELTGHINSSTAHAAEKITYSGEATGTNVKSAIDGLDTRIDNIVAQSGNDNTEIRDARGSYPVLSARLDDVDDRFNDTAVKKNDQFIFVEDFGAVGNGENDDTLPLQQAINYACQNGGIVYFSHSKTYCISSPLEVKPLTPTPARDGSDLHFSKTNSVHLFSTGHSIIKATVVMPHMIKYTFNSNDSSIAPYYSNIEGLQFNGDNKAGVGIYLEWTIHTSIIKCSFEKLETGIFNYGYGVQQFQFNVFKCLKPIELSRGGDNLIQHNDFFPLGGGICIDVGPFSGNTIIQNNIFSRFDDLTSHLVGIRLSGDYSSDGGKEVRNVVIKSNEFNGMSTCIFGAGHATVSNVFNCLIESNHFTPFDTHNDNKFIYFNRVNDSKILNNIFNGRSYIDVKTFIECTNCVNLSFSGNDIYNISSRVVTLNSCQYCHFEHNAFFNTSKTAASGEIIALAGTSLRNRFVDNRFVQSSASYAQNGIVETDDTDYTEAVRNTFVGISNPYYKKGANSIMVV